MMDTRSSQRTAPPLDTTHWFNTDESLSLLALRGKVVVIHAFQMLCPGCVTHGVPQANAIYEFYPPHQVQVMGLHSVFEHHEVMTQQALAAFIHEYRIRFPVAIDRPSSDGPIPTTMSRYGMRGTPTLIILDKKGDIRLHHFGRLSDMQVGSVIGGLLNEASDIAESPESSHGRQVTKTSGGCNEEGCSL